MDENQKKTTLNLDDKDRAYLNSVMAHLKDSSNHKLSIEHNDKLGEFVENSIKTKIDEKIPDFHSNKNIDKIKQALLKVEEKQEKLDEELESVHKWSAYFKTLMIAVLFAILFIGVVTTFMGGLFNVLGFEHLYDGLNYQIKHSEGFVAFLWHLGFLAPYLLLVALIWLLFKLKDKYI